MRLIAITTPKNKNIKINPIHEAGSFLRFGSGGTVVVANAIEDTIGEHRQAHKMVHIFCIDKG
jgi:hypothetical protein